jgi:hypothetical protein
VSRGGYVLAITSDRQLVILSDLVRRAAAVVDPAGRDDVIAELVVSHEDDDVPVRSVLDGLEERLVWGADEDAAAAMTQAVVLYLAHRLDEIDDAPQDILRRAAKAEWNGQPPDAVADWLRERGIAMT